MNYQPKNVVTSLGKGSFLRITKQCKTNSTFSVGRDFYTFLKIIEYKVEIQQLSNKVISFAKFGYKK